MTSKELKKLSRKDLLHLLIEQNDILVQVRNELEEVKTALAKKNMAIMKAGSMAEAAIALSGVFEAADNAAQQYLDSLKATYETHSEVVNQIEAETQVRCERLIEEAKVKAESIIVEAEEESLKMKKATDEYMRVAASRIEDCTIMCECEEQE